MTALAWAYRGFPLANSQPSYEQWLTALRTEFASPRALVGCAGAGAGSNPEKSPGSVHSEVKA